MWQICTCKQEKKALQLPYSLKLRHKNGGNLQNEVRFLKYIQVTFNSDSWVGYESHG